LSGNANQAIAIKATDITGRIIEMRNDLAAGQTVQIGNRYKRGIYIAQITQGNTTKQLKLIKL